MILNNGQGSMKYYTK